MANLRRPTRDFSFSEHQRRSPTQPPPGNELDGAFAELREVVIGMQEALAEIRRDDGQLRNQLVGPEQLKPGLVTTITGDVTKITDLLHSSVQSAISSHTVTAQDISLLAKDAEAAATSAMQWHSQIKQIESRLLAVTRAAETTAASLDTQATDAENWSNNAQAWASNAEKSRDDALAWAEYLAGPVVSGPDAPAFIRQSPYPRGLFYQPIDGMGGMGGLWSAKWWAIYVQQLVGWMSTFYLGAWDHHPSPGEVNPDTGVMVPNPIPVGSFYFNTIKKTLFFWTGDMWVAPFSLTGGVLSRYNYKAIAGQTTFSGPDMFGVVPGDFDDDTEHDVHLNGVKLTRDDGTGKGDYTIDATADSMTLLFPVTADSIVQWDLLVSADDLRPGAAIIFKIDPIAPDGIKTVFTLTYMSGTMSPYITKPEELWVTLDGVNQEPRVDFTAETNLLTFYAPPSATSRIWAVYFRSGNITALLDAPPPAPVIQLSENRVLENSLLGTVVGTLSVVNPYTGTPTFLLSDDAGGKFALVGDTIVVAGPLDYETAVSHNIVVEVMGITPPAAHRTLTIVVKDVFELVEGGIELDGNVVSEDAIIGATIGTFRTVDTIGDTPVFSLLDNAGGKFFVSGNSLRVAAPLDYATAATYFITAAVSGVLPPTDPETFLIIVTPHTISSQIILTGSSVYENAAAGTVVGTLSVTSGTTGTPLFALVESAGGKFVLEGNVIKTTVPFDYETVASYNITVAVTQVSPATPAKTFTIAVLDVFENQPPVITSSASVVNVENTVLAHTLTGTDEQGITWSRVGGADMAHFEIAGSTLRWTGNGTKDYETPGSSLGSNAYVVRVRATDPGALFVEQTITVNVTDAAEGVTFLGGTITGPVTLSDANLGINTSGAAGMAIVANGWKNSGKYYFEATRVAGNTNDSFGVVIEGATMAKVQDFTYGMNWFGIVHNGNVNGRGFSSNTLYNLGTIALGSYACFAVDLDNWKFWVRNAAGIWNNNASANPATNVGGLGIEYLTQTRVAPMASVTTTSKQVFNFGQSAFNGAVPAGFTPGWLSGSHTAIGHPTYARLAAQFDTNAGQIEKGERLAHFGRSPFTDVTHAGLPDFKNTGKYYVEITPANAQGNGVSGFMAHNAINGDLGNGFANNMAIVFNSGAIWSHGVSSGRSIGTVPDEGCIGAAIDLTNAKVWFRNGASGLWNGQAIGLQDPVTNTGGVSISNYVGVDKAMGPMIGLSVISTWRGVINWGQQAFIGALPSGFTAGWPHNPADTTAPTITSSSSVSINELAQLAHALTANEPVVWSIVGGADAARFELTPTSRQSLRWLNDDVKIFGTPNDADLNNQYIVTVRATDLSGNQTNQTITVTVLDTIYDVSFTGGTNTNATLTLGGLRVEKTTGTMLTIASTAFKNTGKFYFEAKITISGNTDECVGVAAEGATTAQIFNSWPVGAAAVNTAAGAIRARGFTGVPGANLGAGTAVGSVFCFAVDLDNWRFWARKNGGNWNNNASANPATNVGGIDIGYWSQTRIAPMCMLTTGQWLYNFGAGAFAFTVPAGFTPGWGPSGSQTAIGHPTYAYLTYSTDVANAKIEKGERLYYTPSDAFASVGTANMKSAGKFYFECEFPSINSFANEGCGLVTNDATWANVGGGLNSSYVNNRGGIQSNDVNSGRSLGVLAVESVVGVAVDLDNEKVWFRVAPSGNWNGQAIGSQDPANNIGGVSISLYSAKTMGPAVMGFFAGSQTSRNVLNLGQRTFVGAVPSGFTGGWRLGST